MAATAALFDDDIRSGGVEYATARQKERIVQNLAARANAENLAATTGYAAFDAIDGKRDGVPTVAGLAASEFELNARTAKLAVAFGPGSKAYDPNVYGAIQTSLATNARMIGEWNAIADAQLVDDVKLWGRYVLKGGAFFAGGVGLAANVAETGIAFNNGEISANEAALSMSLNARGISGGRSLVAIDRSAIPASSAAQGARLGDHLRQLEKYGSQGFKELENGRFRYFGDVAPANTPGEMVGRRLVREWDPASGVTRTWHETLDAAGNVRQVRPQTSGAKVHYQFDADGKYIGKW